MKENCSGFVAILTLTLVFFTSLVNGNLDNDKYNEENGKAYLKKINEEIQIKTTESVLASWGYESNITDENLANQLEAATKLANFTNDIWKETIKYPWKTYKDPDVKRQFQKLSVLGTAILSPEKYEQYNKIVSDMQSVYGKAKVCNYYNRTDCSLQLEPELTEIFVKSRDPNELRYYWEAWRNAAGKPVREMYEKYVELSNEAAVLNNFTDTSEFWLKDYEAEDFKEQVEVLWEQVKPLYLELHAYVRRRLREKYGEEHVSKTGPIPAHLLGNMWAQTWGNVYDFTMPFPGKASVDVTENMVKQGYTPLRMFKLAEEFFTSLGLSPMPETFWNNSILERPKDGRDLICHASAWDFYDGIDFRIKQCTRINMEDLNTVHHEMGHVQYFLQYKKQPLVYKEGSNPGFHEAIGDVMALSVSTPKHLKKIGLLDNIMNDEESDLNQLYSMALDKIAFLPFGYLMDQWRWSVFQGKTTEKEYNCKWWQLREKYQGLSPSVVRSEADFDPGSKYHTIANVPYIRYFVSFVIQFQFHRSLCIAAKEYDPMNPSLKPLHQCDIYQSKEAGALLKKMLEMGSSKPWPDAMEVLTGQRKMDASALLDYFATLRTWLENENKRTGEMVGWETSSEACGIIIENFTPSSAAISRGYFEGGNIGNFNVEFVHQEDNAFGTPDFVEETKASCRSINPDSEKSAELGGKIVLNNSDFKVLVKKVECQDNDNQEIPPYTKSNVHKLKLNGPFQIRSKNNELERAKILNAILKDVRNFKANKQCGSAIKGCRAKANQILLEEFLKAKSANENGEGPGKEVEPKMEEDDKLKTDKGGESKSQDDKNLMPAVLPFANEYFPRMKNIGKTVGCSTENPCKNIIRLEPFDDSKETKESCTERPNVVCKEPDNQNPNNELMRKATYVKNKALQMLQLFNMSCLEDNQTKPDISNNCFQVLDGVFEAPTQSSKCPEEFLQNRDDDKNEKVPRKYKAYPGIPESFSRNSLLKLIKNKLASKNNLQRSFYKEYAVFNMIPRNNFNERMKNEQKQRLKSKRKARPTRANNYVLLMGKLPDRGGGNRKTPVKKSYKEFNFSTRNPVVYNSVVISSGDKVEKTDDNRDNFTRRRSLNYERNLNAYGSGRVRSRTSRRVREDNFKNAFSKSVRRKQININNIVQYFGLAKTFVKTVYLRPFLGQRSYLGGEGGGVKTAKLELNVTHIRPHYCLSNIL